MTTTINASTSSGLVNTADTSGIIKVQSNGVTTNALAWVNFNGTSGASPVIRASYNVSSVTRNTTGYYTIVFTNALTDANYSIVGATSTNGSNPSGGLQINSQSIAGSWALVTPTTTQFSVGVLQYNGVAALDPTYACIAIFGN